MATIETQSPPSGWRLTTGTWGTDAELVEVSPGAFLNDKYLNLKNTAAATRIESGKIPLRNVAQANTRYDICVGYQVSSVAAGNLVTIGIEYYNDSETVAATSYLNNSAGAAQNGIVAPNANIKEYASFRLTVSTQYKFARIFVLKSATAFNLQVHGLVVRHTVPCDLIESDGTVAVPDNGATWTTVPVVSTGLKNSTTAPAALPGDTSSAIIPPAFVMCHAVIKCDDVPSGSEFAIRLSVDSMNNPSTVTYTGQRIVSAAGSKTWEICATAMAHPEGLGYLQVEAQHSGGGAAGNITVELVHGFITELQSWL